MALETFETERLTLRPRSRTDLEACLAMDRDPLVTRFVSGPWSDPQKHRTFVLSRMEAIYPAGMGYWTVCARDRPREFLGWILLLSYPAVREEVEIGWRLVRREWGNGYASEAAAAVLDHAFATVDLDTVVADIHPDNLASIRVAEKIGMAFAEHRVLDGEPARSYRISSDRPRLKAVRSFP